MKSIDEILWPRGRRDITDAEEYARQWWIEFHQAQLQKQQVEANESVETRL